MDAPHITEAERKGYPEPAIVGNCEACNGDMYDYQRTVCDGCNAIIHTACRKVCPECKKVSGCRRKSCMVYDNISGEHFCSNECRDKFNEDTAYERDE